MKFLSARIREDLKSKLMIGAIKKNVNQNEYLMEILEKHFKEEEMKENEVR